MIIKVDQAAWDATFTKSFKKEFAAKIIAGSLAMFSVIFAPAGIHLIGEAISEAKERYKKAKSDNTPIGERHVTVAEAQVNLPPPVVEVHAAPNVEVHEVPNVEVHEAPKDDGHADHVAPLVITVPAQPEPLVIDIPPSRASYAMPSFDEVSAVSNDVRQVAKAPISLEEAFAREPRTQYEGPAAYNHATDTNQIAPGVLVSAMPYFLMVYNHNYPFQKQMHKLRVPAEKIHINVHRDDIGKAWDALFPLFTAKDTPFHAIKFSAPSAIEEAVQKERGGEVQHDLARILRTGQVTVYLPTMSGGYGRKIGLSAPTIVPWMRQVELAFKDAGVRVADYQDKKTYPVSDYFTFRDELVGRSQTPEDTFANFEIEHMEKDCAYFPIMKEYKNS